LHENKPAYALFRYLELTLIGDPVGMINGLYVMSLFEDSVNLGPDTWDIKRITSDPLLQKLKETRHPIPRDP
jgi:hypothetical protein